jgi:hypothetical protein
MKQKLTDILLGLVAIMFLFIVTYNFRAAYIDYSKRTPVKVLELHSLKILTNPVVAGNYYQYEVCSTKYVDVVGVVSKELANTTVITYTDKPATAPVGHHCIKRWEWMPSYADPDIDYTMVFRVTYPDVDGHKVLPVRIVSPTFTVVKKLPCPKRTGGNP